MTIGHVYCAAAYTYVVLLRTAQFQSISASCLNRKTATLAEYSSSLALRHTFFRRACSKQTPVKTLLRRRYVYRQVDSNVIISTFLSMLAVLAAMIRSRKGKHFAALAVRSPIWRQQKAFLKPNDSILLKYRDKSSPVDFPQYEIMPYNTEILS